MKRPEALAAGVLGLAAASALWPLLAMPAFLAVTLAFVVTTGRPRLLVIAIAAPLMCVGFYRFLIAYAVPNIVIAGQMAAEDRAISRLREIRWAELELQRKRNGDHPGASFVPLRDLVSDNTDEGGAAAPLSGRVFHAEDPSRDVFRADAYELRLYLPEAGGGWTSDAAKADPARAAGAFIAYAWPAGEASGGQRAFFIDQNDQICEAKASRFRGPGNPPPPTAAFNGAIGALCGGTGAPDWHAWKNKKPIARQENTPSG
jgi:hypothetical protein